MKEVYISIDVESDGPCPGRNSLLSIGAAAVSYDLQLLGTFTVNLELLPDAKPNPKTKEFWDKNPAAYAATRTDLHSPLDGMEKYLSWIETFMPATNPVRVGFPIVYDGMWDRYYFLRFARYDPFGHNGIDIKTMGFVVGQSATYNGTSKRFLKRLWPTTKRHTHIALDDAMEQAEIFIGMMKEMRK